MVFKYQKCIVCGIILCNKIHTPQFVIQQKNEKNEYVKLLQLRVQSSSMYYIIFHFLTIITKLFICSVEMFRVIFPMFQWIIQTD